MTNNTTAKATINEVPTGKFTRVKKTRMVEEHYMEEVPVTEKQVTLMLLLTERDACALRKLSGSVNGDSHGSIRGLFDAVYEALESAGFHFNAGHKFPFKALEVGHIEALPYCECGF